VIQTSDLCRAWLTPPRTLGQTGTRTCLSRSGGGRGATIGDTGGLAFDEATGALYATFAANGGFYRNDRPPEPPP
jgi:hypothetical protein